MSSPTPPVSTSSAAQDEVAPPAPASSSSGPLCRGPWYWLVGTILDPNDTYTDRMRKGVVAFGFFPMGPIALANAAGGYLSAQTDYHILASTATLVMGLNFFLSYLWVRRQRQMTDRHTAFAFWWSVISLTINYISGYSFDNKSLAFISLFLLVIVKFPHLIAASIFISLQLLMIDWNEAVQDTGKQDLLITFPGPPRDMGLVQTYAQHVLMTVMLGGCVYLFFKQSREHARREVGQLAANAMTIEVLKHQRRYDTKKVSEILLQCSEEGVVDQQLVQLFQEMNSNLTTFKPFLPNYILEQLTSGGDDDEEEDMCRHNEKEEEVEEGSIKMEDSESEVESQKGNDERSGFHTTTELGVSGADVSSRTSSRSSFSQQQQQQQQQQIQSLAPMLVNLNKRGPIFHGKISFAVLDLNINRLFSTGGHLSSSSLHHEALTSIVNILHKIAHETKASIHSMLGDKVQLTWNATYSVPLLETKAATFMLRVSSELKKQLNSISQQILQEEEDNNDDQNSSRIFSSSSSCPISVSGILCSGKAAIHSVTSSTQGQQALIIEAPSWLPTSVDAGFELAVRHRTLIMDESTAKSCAMEVDALPIERLSAVGSALPGEHTVETFPVHPQLGFLYHHVSQLFHPPPVESCTERSSSAVVSAISGGHKTTLFEILRLKVRNDDEWMYQLQADEEDNFQQQRTTSNSNNSPSGRKAHPKVLCSQILDTIAQRRIGEATMLLEMLCERRRKSSSSSSTKGQNPLLDLSCMLSDSILAEMTRHCEKAMLCNVSSNEQAVAR